MDEEDGAERLRRRFRRWVRASAPPITLTALFWAGLSFVASIVFAVVLMPHLRNEFLFEVMASRRRERYTTMVGTTALSIVFVAYASAFLLACIAAAVFSRRFPKLSIVVSYPASLFSVVVAGAILANAARALSSDDYGRSFVGLVEFSGFVAVTVSICLSPAVARRLRRRRRTAATGSHGGQEDGSPGSTR